jgi:hypothetical protein
MNTMEKIWHLYFSFSLLLAAKLKFWLPYGYMVPVKKSLVLIEGSTLSFASAGKNKINNLHTLC